MRRVIKNSKLIFIILILGPILGAVWVWSSQNSDQIYWSMIHVSGDDRTGDAHLLEFPDGHVVLIDTGFEEIGGNALLPYLKSRDIDEIHQLVITHAHRNHYGATKPLVNMMTVNDVFFNWPPRQGCEKERFIMSCNLDHIEKMRQIIRDQGANILTLSTGEILYQDVDREITLSVVIVHDGESEPIGKTSINDTSAVLLLRYKKLKVLFTGDIHKIGKHLVKNDYDITAQILTAPHHGTEAAASNKFLKKVNPEVLMVSSSKVVWEAERSQRFAKFAKERNIPVFITGLDGNVVVSLDGENYSISINN